MFAKWRDAVTTLLSIVAIVISMASAAFSYLQWKDQHTQFLLSMKPAIDFDTEPDTASPPVGIAVINGGPAPARIASVTFYVDRKPVRNAQEVIAYGKFDPLKVDYMEYETDDTLAVGEHQFLLSYVKNAKAGDKEFERFATFIDQNVAVNVRFCSPLATNDSGGPYCWEKCSAKGRC